MIAIEDVKVTKVSKTSVREHKEWMEEDEIPTLDKQLDSTKPIIREAFLTIQRGNL
jgi:hypothetical protein